MSPACRRLRSPSRNAWWQPRQRVRQSIGRRIATAALRVGGGVVPTGDTQAAANRDRTTVQSPANWRHRRASRPTAVAHLAHAVVVAPATHTATAPAVLQLWFSAATSAVAVPPRPTTCGRRQSLRGAVIAQLAGGVVAQHLTPPATSAQVCSVPAAMAATLLPRPLTAGRELCRCAVLLSPTVPQ